MPSKSRRRSPSKSKAAKAKCSLARAVAEEANPSASISSSFVNTAALSCRVSSWTLGLDKGLSTTNAARHFKTDDRGPWKKILPAGPCVKAEDCSLNGECVSGRCVCTASWSGHNCERLALRPLPARYGYGRTPNIT